MYNEFTTHSHKHIKYHFTNVTIYFYNYRLLLQIQTLVFQHRDERRTKAELSSASLNLYPLNASYLQGETIKGPFISLSLSH